MKIQLFIIVLSVSNTFCFAQISLPKIFGNNMVLQRNALIPIWGNAGSGATIIATLGNSTVTARAEKNGRWMLRFPKFKAGGPYTLKIAEQGKPGSKIEFNNILVGDVWLASGQSNMEWQVQQSMDAKNEIAKASYPNIRFLQVEHSINLAPQSTIKTEGWKVIDTNSVKNISAVAYFFACKINSGQNVPVGILQTAWGGTPAEAWTSREMLLSSPISKAKTLSNDTLSLNEDIAKIDSLNWASIWNIVYNPKNNTDKSVTNIQYNDADWPAVEMPNLMKDFGIGFYEGMVWLRKKITLPESFDLKKAAISLGHPEMNYSLYINGEEICKNIWNANLSHSYTIPASLLQPGENVIALRMAMMWGGGGLNPPAEDLYITDGISKISLAGKYLFNKNLETAFPKVLNYQYYPTMLFNGMINPLIPYGIKGFIWYQGESNAWGAYDYRKLFPMLITDWRQRWQQGSLPFLYVQLANFMKSKPQPAESEWAELREAQTMTLSLPNTGMVCAIDIGEANDIHPKNKQEVGRRLALIAEQKVYNRKIIASGPVYKSYQINGAGVKIIFSNSGSALKIKDGNSIRGFAIAGADKKFYWADAEIKGNSVMVYSKNVLKPVAVRYAWADNPECNLVNSEGLPAVPFRTDNWKGITQK